tara:strand:- start:48296 stop:49609 length:1314 start_codon:yes stop_codon:yes gene_type:complete
MIITEQEKNNILNLHHTHKNVNGMLLNEQLWDYLFGPSDYDTRETGVPDAADNERIQSMFNKFIESGKEIEKGKVVMPTKRHGDEFRVWAHKRLPGLVKKYKVSKSGDHNSPLLTKILNQRGKSGKTVLGLYTEVRPTWMHLELKEKLERKSVKVPNTVKNADRINRELEFINQRGFYDHKAFFIVDPRLNLVLAFDKDHELIDYSQSVAGADKQKEEVFTYADWCVASGLKYNQYAQQCADADVEQITADTPRTTKKMSYAILADIQARYAAKGIYSVGNSFYNPGYEGKENVVNTLMLDSPDGEKLGTAIHGLVPIQNRLKADAVLSKALKQAKSKNEIPQEYIDLVERYHGTDEFDKSAGCFNVSAEFINNPAVLRMAQAGVPVFIMGESKTDYLVQVKPSDNDNFFNALGGNEGYCMDASQLISDFGNKVSLS